MLLLLFFADGQYLYNVTIKYSDYATCTILHHHDATRGTFEFTLLSGRCPALKNGK